MEQTTIQIDNRIRTLLLKQKMSEKESYNDILERILEDAMEFTEQTKKDIAESKKQAEKGETHSLKEIKEIFGIE